MISESERQELIFRKNRLEQYLERYHRLEKCGSPEAFIQLNIALEYTSELMGYVAGLIEKLTDREFILKRFSKETH